MEDDHPTPPPVMFDSTKENKPSEDTADTSTTTETITTPSAEVTKNVVDDDAGAGISPPSSTLQMGLVIFSALYTTLFSGAFFGWGPMQLMLEDDGAFQFKCKDSDLQDEPCEAQTLSLLNVQFIATFMSILAPVLGYITDRYGVLTLMKILAASNCGGISLIIIASTTQIDQLYYPAICGIGISFVATSVIIVQTGMVFDGSMQRRVISLLNALIDAGSVTYLILYKIYEALDTTLVGIAFGYLGVALFCFGGALYFWTAIIRLTEEIATEDTQGDILNQTDKTTIATDPQVPEAIMTDDEYQKKQNAEDLEAPPASSGTSSGGYVLVALRKPADQLKSKQYLLLVTFFLFHVGRNNFTTTATRDWLASLGDDDEGNRYLAIFTALSVASMIGLPFIDFLLEHYGYHLGLQAINILGIFHGVIQVSTTNLDLQILGFVIYSFYRCFTFAVAFSFLSTFLGGETIGRGAGFLASCGALTSLLNIGIASWIIKGLNEDYFVVNLLYTIGIVPIILITCAIGRCILEEEAAKTLMDQAGVDRSSHAAIQLTPHLTMIVEHSENPGDESLHQSFNQSFNHSFSDIGSPTRRVSYVKK